MPRPSIASPLARQADRRLSAIEGALDQPLLTLLAWIQRRRVPRSGRLGLMLRGVRILALVVKLTVLGGLLGDHVAEVAEWMVKAPALQRVDVYQPLACRLRAPPSSTIEALRRTIEDQSGPVRESRELQPHQRTFQT